MKKIATAAAVALFALGVVTAAPSPAEARDTGWGCGGAC